MFKINRKRMAQKLAVALGESNLTINDVAKELEVQPKTVLAWLSGKSMPSAVRFANLCLLLKTDPNSFLGLPLGISKI